MPAAIRQIIVVGLMSMLALGLRADWACGAQDADPKPEQKPEQKPERKPEQKPAQSADKAKPGESFAELMAAWKKVIAELKILQERYAAATDAERTRLVEQYNVLRREGSKMAPLLEEAAVREYQAAPNKDLDLAEFLIVLVVDKMNGQQFEAADRLAAMLIDAGIDALEFKDFKVDEIYRLAGTAKYNLGDWATAAVYLAKAQEAQLLDSDKPAKGAYQLVRDETARKKFENDWRREQKVRAAEAKADDLPRVVLRTTRGDIVLELFENEAPNTVANFVSLVEKKFYDGLAFHRVIPHFMVQGGDPKGDGSGGPGYRIKCECYEENHRKHFRGSLSMAKSDAINTGGSQFFLCFVPTLHLNGKHTVFGRVIEGIENMSALRRNDKIVVAKVLRKRKHQYKPSTLPDVQP